MSTDLPAAFPAFALARGRRTAPRLSTPPARAWAHPCPTPRGDGGAAKTAKRISGKSRWANGLALRAPCPMAHCAPRLSTRCPPATRYISSFRTSRK
jgi:hypothetical protein